MGAGLSSDLLWGVADIMMGVPVPINKKKMMKLSTVDMARAMAFVIGCDPNFDYAENYIAYIKAERED